jgi:hypothetical protein
MEKFADIANGLRSEYEKNKSKISKKIKEMKKKGGKYFIVVDKENNSEKSSKKSSKKSN